MQKHFVRSSFLGCPKIYIWQPDNMTFFLCIISLFGWRLRHYLEWSYDMRNAQELYVQVLYNCDHTELSQGTDSLLRTFVLTQRILAPHLVMPGLSDCSR